MAFTQYTTELNGQRYAYLDEGEGPLLVFGHGVLADKSMFEAQIEALRDRYRCVSLDWPGHTGSGYREKGWSFYDMADDSVALLDQLGYDEAIFVGLSQGGMTFMRLALKCPERVRALVLLDTSADPEDADLLPVHRQQQSRFAHGSDAERDGVVTRMQKFLYAKPWRDANPDGVAHEKALILAHDRHGIELALENVFTRDDISGDISAISAPTLVIVGELDRATPPEKAQRIVDAIPGARLVTVADSGHHSPIENPEAVNRALSDFLATL